MEGVVHRNPQAAYAGMKKYLQNVFHSVQCITPDVVPEFGTVQ